MSKLSGKYLDPNSFKNNVSVGNGVSVDFVLTDTPASALMLTVSSNGIINIPTTEYTLSNKTITFVTAPEIGQKLIFSYIKA